MRFHKLTITLTLTCLSIVAVAGLFISPITGNCQVLNHGWTDYNDNKAANFMATDTTTGDSWQLSASVDAKGVSASVSPSSYNLSQFTETTDPPYMGTGLVTAFRDNYTYSHYHWWWEHTHSDDLGKHTHSDGFGEHTHTVHGDIDTNHPTSPFYNGKDTGLTLDIQISKTEKHTCWARNTTTNRKLTVSLGANADIVEAKTEFTIGTTEYEALSQSVKTTVTIPTVAQEVGVDASVSFDEKADSSAHTNFDFDGFSESGSKWYDAP